MKHKLLVVLSVTFGLFAFHQPAFSQTARVALETYEEGPVWEDWAAIDAETVDTPEFQERMGRMESTGTEFLGTVFAREVRLKAR